MNCVWYFGWVEYKNNEMVYYMQSLNSYEIGYAPVMANLIQNYKNIRKNKKFFRKCKTYEGDAWCAIDYHNKLYELWIGYGELDIMEFTNMMSAFGFQYAAGNIHYV